MKIKVGDKFGDWTVIANSNKKYYYTCKCKCGKIQDVYKSSLVSGKSKGCMACAKDKIRKSKRDKFDKDVIGNKFGKLTPLKSLSDKGRAAYLCKCDCGNFIEVKRSELLSGKTKSCGCIRTETSKKSMEKIQKQGLKTLKKASIDGTNLYSLHQKTSKNSTTGIKGVSYTKSGKYRAYINLKRKQKHLGVFDTLEEAKKAREEAEKEIFDPLFEKHKE